MDIGNSNTRWTKASATESSNIQTIPTDQLAEHLQTEPIISNHSLLVSSVVPNTHAIFPKHTHFIDHTNIPILKIAPANPSQIGADRLVNALAAYQLTQSPVLIIDSGTALTFCYVDETGTYQGGQIFPGMGIASQSLNDYTAKIPLIKVKPVGYLTGSSTQEAVESGLYHGYFHIISGIINSYRQQIPNIQIMGTGGGLDLYNDTLQLDHYEPDLIFLGLRKILSIQHLSV